MSRMSEFWRKLLLLFQRERMERELAEEMEAHIHELTEEKLRTGMSPEEAERAARKQFGEPMHLRSSSRAAWGWPRLESLVQDVGHGLRILRRNPGFAAAAVLSLALGIGVNVTVFGFLNGVFWGPIPGTTDSEELVAVYQYFEREQGEGGYHTSFSWPAAAFFQEHAVSFTGMAASTPWEFGVRAGAGTEKLIGEVVSPDYFSVLGIPMAVGRGLGRGGRAGEGDALEVVLAYGYWQRALGGDREVVGGTIWIGGSAFTVVGIAQPGFRGLLAQASLRPELWIPAGAYRQALPSLGGFDMLGSWGAQNFTLVGRRREGVGLEQARRDLERVSGLLLEQRPEREGLRPLVYAAERVRFWPGQRERLMPFLHFVALLGVIVLVMACANVGSLLVVRARRRQRELAVRLSLGAGRGRLARQLLTENLLLVLLGGVAAMLLASWISGLLVRNSGIAPSLTGWGALLDPLSLLFTSAVLLITGTIITLFPLSTALRSGLSTASHLGAGTVGRRRSRIHEFLVAAQVALTVVLVAGAGLFLQTLHKARTAEVTREPERVLTAELDLGAAGYAEERGQAAYEGLLREIRALPGVEEAALVRIVPLGGRRGGVDLLLDAGGGGEEVKEVQVGRNVVSEGYFRTIGIPLVRGRSFSTADRAASRPVVIVNEVLVRRLFGEEEMIGRTLRFGSEPEEPVTIVGVVRDGKFRTYRSDPEPTVYLPLAQRFQPAMNLEIRTAGPPTGLAPVLRRRVAAIDRDIVLTDIQTHADRMRSLLSRERLSAFVLTSLGALALLLAAAGLFGLLSYIVSGRRRELGVRMALGAAPGRIVRQVLGEVVVTVVPGAGVGVVAALALGQAVRGLLYGVGPAEPIILGMSIGVLLLAAGLAAVLPARRAVGIDPVRALRVE